MSDSLSLLKRELAQSGGELQLLTSDEQSTSELTSATHLKLVKNDKTLFLDEPTIYVTDDGAVPLRVCYFTWLYKDLGRAELIEVSEQNKVTPLGLLQKSDLCTWLDGSKNEFEFSVRQPGQDAGVASGAGDDKMDIDDPFLDSILSHERNLVDHNTSLRGSKDVDFTNVADSCKRVYLQPASKKDKKSSSHGSALLPSSSSSSSKSSSAKRKANPIILISPAASAVLTMSNIKSFLEKGVFVDPNTTDVEQQQQYLSSTDLSIVTHVFPKIGKVSFMIVNNTDKFSKDEYWDRTVAIFTTGQAWQFKNYKWTNPGQLFQKIKGYYFHYDKDPIPSTINDWNVEKIGLDKYRRFRDAVVLIHFWNGIENELIRKGWSTKN